MLMEEPTRRPIHRGRFRCSIWLVIRLNIKTIFIVVLGFTCGSSFGGIPARGVQASAGVLKLEHMYANKGRAMSSEHFEAVEAHDRARHRRFLDAVVVFQSEGSSDPYIAGLYYTKVMMGTPPKEYHVQIDTGSDILWLNCKPCDTCPLTSGLGITLNVFDTQGSTTTSPLPCEDTKCVAANQLSSETSCTPDHYCGYSFEYGDGSGTLGYYVSDLLRFNQILDQGSTNNASAPIIFGCSFKQSGDLMKPDRAVDGIFGFGQHDLSVVSQLHSQGLAPKVFSHCLRGPDHGGGGILVLGEITDPKIVYSPIVKSQPHYNLNLLAIAVNGQNLPIDPQVFATSNGGTIIDCGTTLTYLAEEAYNPFVNRIVTSVSQSLQVFYLKGNPCFVTSNSIDDIFPLVTLYFEGAVMELKPRDYLIQQASSDNTPIWCMGWQKSGDHTDDKTKMTILGDIVLKDKIFVYDLDNQRIGWTSFDCSAPVNLSSAPSDNKSIDSAKLNSSGSPPSEILKEFIISFCLLALAICI